MNSEKGPQNEISLNDALVYIQAKDMETRVTGRIDSEPSMFKSIEQALNSRVITPREAVKQVDELIASRQDYN